MAGGTRAALSAIALAALAAGASVVACFDVLHSTSDLRTACEIDPDQARCGADFCAWSPAEAEAHALHACSWLGACESPMGKNAFGPCMFRARMAYDCHANPHHAVRGATRDLWACLQGAQSCEEVDSCVFEQRPVQCSPVPETACGTGAADVRVSCAVEDGGAVRPRGGENCALWGETCERVSSTCTGMASAPKCTRGCDEAAILHWCSVDPTDPAPQPADAGAPVDLGLDCRSNGAGACAYVPPDSSFANWVACEPASDAGRCAFDASASCSGGISTSCLTGELEQLDCASLLGSRDACISGPLSPAFDWTSPCAVSPPQCTTDACDGDRLASCERGAPFTASCSQEGLGPCRLVAAEPAAAPRAACTPPAGASAAGP